MPKRLFLNSQVQIIMAIVLGAIAGFFSIEPFYSFSNVVAEISIKLMKLLATPLLFLSIVSSTSHFKNFNDIKFLGKNIIKYTLLTTFIAALIAETLFHIASPWLFAGVSPSNSNTIQSSKGFFLTLLETLPDNFFGAFLSNNILAVVMMAIALALAILSIKEEEREIVFGFFNGMQSALMRLVHMGIKFLPIIIFAFVLKLFVQISQEHTHTIGSVLALTITVIASNLIQGLVVLPIILFLNGQKPLKLFLSVKEALVLAFFTRSSAATLPLTLDQSIQNAQVDKKVAKLSLPLCTTINMNGCAQFILLSVYFVAFHTNNAISPGEHVAMIFVAVLAAVGNAGVPMGCFFLSSSILASKDIPIYLMGSILPFYMFIDMVETSLNVWSDVCVTKIVDIKNKNHIKKLYGTLQP